jgi:hypothetical protein
MIQAKKKERNGTRTERQIYIYIIYNGTTTTKKKKRNKQETDYNKILVGARTRDRKQTKEEMIINSRLNGSNLVFVFFFKSHLQVYNPISSV